MELTNMLQNIEVIESNGTEFNLNKSCLDYLDQIGKSITFDFEEEELLFFLPNDEVILLDFEDIQLRKLSKD